MKKFLAACAAILTAAVMAGCNNPADEQIIEDITGDISTAAEAELPETSAIIEKATKMTSETTSETEKTTAEETATVKITKAEPISNESVVPLVGRWTESRAYIYEFDEKGNVSINTGYYTVIGDYTCEENHLLLSLMDSDGEVYNYNFDIVADDNGCAMYYKPVENKWGFYDPYEPAGLMSGWMSALWDNEDPFYLKKGEEPRPANVEDLDGIWIDQIYGELVIFEKNRNIYLHETYADIYESTLKNGIFISYDDDGDEESCILWLYDNKLYMSNCYSAEPSVLERYEAEPHTLSLSDFEGDNSIRVNGKWANMRLEKGKGICEYDDRIYDAAISVIDNSRVNLRVNGEKTVYDHYIVLEEESEYYLDKYIYLYNDESAICINNYTMLERNN